MRIALWLHERGSLGGEKQAAGAGAWCPRRPPPAGRASPPLCRPPTITCAGHTTSFTSFCVDKRVADLPRVDTIPSASAQGQAQPPLLLLSFSRNARGGIGPLVVF